jgi:hypothetical protein
MRAIGKERVVGRVKIPDAHRYRRGRNILSERSDDVR